MSISTFARVVSELREPGAPSLTPRQLECAYAVITRGETTEAIAQRMNCDVNTVGGHMRGFWDRVAPALEGERPGSHWRERQRYSLQAIYWHRVGAAGGEPPQWRWSEGRAA